MNQPIAICILVMMFLGTGHCQSVDITDKSALMIESVPDEILDGQVIWNGGYFDMDGKAVGYLKKNGVIVSGIINGSISGFVGINEVGKITVSNKLDDIVDCVSIFQSGPFLVDPGGEMGINTDQGKLFDRLVLIRLKDGRLFLRFAEKVDLFDLAKEILDEYENVDLALNLDGGPSVCLIGAGLEIRPSKSGPYLISCQ